MGGLIVDAFAGPGGWSEGLRILGLSDVGIELDAKACATRAAAGHRTIRQDVETVDTGRLAGAVGLLMSPPCTDFSLAGRRAGIEGDAGRLIWTVLHWIRDIRPEWVACEQVPPALHMWEFFAPLLRQLGYDTWTGILNAADYGVPQTRERAFLLANRTASIAPPEPTHAEAPQAVLFGAELEPWVTMYEAVGWGFTDRPAYTFCGGSGGGGMDLRRWQRRATWHPAGARAAGRFVVDRHTNSKDGRGGMYPTVTVPLDRPSPTLTGKAIGQWTIHDLDEPHVSIKLTVPDALAIQSFRRDYPVQGPKGIAGQQIGNAVPPLLAAHVISAVSGVALPELREVA